MTTQNHDSIDSSATAWDALAPKTTRMDPAPQFAPVPVPQEDSEWRWGWNWFIGIHYGPIPVGLIVGIPLLIALRS